MMLIDTYVSTSGIFTKEKIKKDARIWRFDEGFDVVLIPDQLYSMPNWQRSFFETYCFMNEGKLYYCCDNARFMNHSENPNTYEKPDGTYAKIDIEIGEELTCDYATFGVTQEDFNFNIAIFNTLKESAKITIK